MSLGKALTPTGSLPRGFPRFNADRSRLLLTMANEIQVHDARSGALLQSMPGGFQYAKFLRDGRVAAAARDGKSMTIFSSSAPVNVPVTTDRIYESPAGPVIACSRTGCSVVDSSTGTILRTEAGLHPLSWFNTTTNLLSTLNGEVIVWNPATGEKRPIT